MILASGARGPGFKSRTSPTIILLFGELRGEIKKNTTFVIQRNSGFKSSTSPSIILQFGELRGQTKRDTGCASVT